MRDWHSKILVNLDHDLLVVREKTKKVKLIRVPKFSEIPYPTIMEPNLVIEYYSR